MSVLRLWTSPSILRLAVWLFCLHTNFRISLSISIEQPAGILTGTAVNQQVKLGRNPISTESSYAFDIFYFFLLRYHSFTWKTLWLLQSPILSSCLWHFKSNKWFQPCLDTLTASLSPQAFRYPLTCDLKPLSSLLPSLPRPALNLVFSQCADINLRIREKGD